MPLADEVPAALSTNRVSGFSRGVSVGDVVCVSVGVAVVVVAGDPGVVCVVGDDRSVAGGVEVFSLHPARTV